MIYGGDEIRYTLTLKYNYSYSFSEAVDSDYGKLIGSYWWVRFTLKSSQDSYTGVFLEGQSNGIKNALTVNDYMPFDVSRCFITTTTSNMTWDNMTGVVAELGSDRMYVLFGNNKRASNFGASGYGKILQIPKQLDFYSPLGSGCGIIHCNTSGTITFVIDYYVKAPQFQYDGKALFDLGFPTKENGQRLFSTREIMCKFKQPTVIPGTRSLQDAELTYSLWEKNIVTTTETEIWTFKDDEIELNENTGVYEIRSLPLQCRITRDYILKTEYGGDGFSQYVESFTTPGPEAIMSPSVEMRYIGEDFELTSAQMVNHLIATVHGDSVTLWWTNPILYYSEDLNINFQILISRNSIPQHISDSHILDIVPGNTGGKDYRSFPGSVGYVNQLFRSGEYSEFFFYTIADGQILYSEDFPRVEKDTVVPSNNDYKEADDGMPYLYSYTVSTQQLQKYAENYDKIYFAIRPIIERKLQNDTTGWREGTQLKEDPRPEDWHPFIFILNTTTSYCSDEYWNDEKHAIELGALEWRQCQIYYCPDGENWKLVSAQFPKDDGTWAFC